MQEEPILRIQHLNLWYGENHALKDVALDIPAHRITALIGPSGCGKSTFLRTLNRMNDLIPGIKISGSLTYRGSEIYDPAQDVTALRKNIGMVFQKPNPFPMSIYDNVAYGPRTHGIRSRVQLDEIVEQRLCIARALAVKPDVLLMDESTSALDPISTSKIEDLAMELKKEYTIVIVTHNMQQAVRVSDRTAFFLLGELIECDDTEKMFSQPADKRTEDYITGRFG